MLQEYIPEEVADDWIFHGYFNAQSECLVGFTGVKYRSLPAYFGATTYSASCRESGSSRRSRSSSSAGSVTAGSSTWTGDSIGATVATDCSIATPRIGAQFRLFETTAGIDVVRTRNISISRDEKSRRLRR